MSDNPFEPPAIRSKGADGTAFSNAIKDAAKAHGVVLLTCLGITLWDARPNVMGAIVIIAMVSGPASVAWSAPMLASALYRQDKSAAMGILVGGTIALGTSALAFVVFIWASVVRMQA